MLRRRAKEVRCRSCGYSCSNEQVKCPECGLEPRGRKATARRLRRRTVKTFLVLLSITLLSLTVLLAFRRETVTRFVLHRLPDSFIISRVTQPPGPGGPIIAEFAERSRSRSFLESNADQLVHAIMPRYPGSVSKLEFDVLFDLARFDVMPHEQRKRFLSSMVSLRYAGVNSRSQPYLRVRPAVTGSHDLQMRLVPLWFEYRGKRATARGAILTLDHGALAMPDDLLVQHLFDDWRTEIERVRDELHIHSTTSQEAHSEEMVSLALCAWIFSEEKWVAASAALDEIFELIENPEAELPASLWGSVQCQFGEVHAYRTTFVIPFTVDDITRVFDHAQDEVLQPLK